jgi:hypothetical protein
MKWGAFAEDDHLALEFTPNFNEYPGGFLVDPDATPESDFGWDGNRGVGKLIVESNSMPCGRRWLG